MSDFEKERRDALVAGAVGGDLTRAQRTELDRLIGADASIEAEIVELRAVSGRVDALASWDSSAIPAALRERVIGIVGTPGESPTSALSVLASGSASPSSASPSSASPSSASPGRRAARRRPRARRQWTVALAAAACIAVGAGGALAVEAATTAPRTGPPGTPGAIEAVEFTDEADGVDVDGSLVAHSWGTETILEIDGLAPSGTYAVVLVGRDGARVTSGTFFGSELTVDCRMNAAVDRGDVVAVEIEDATGSLIAQASVPAVA